MFYGCGFIFAGGLVVCFIGFAGTGLLCYFPTLLSVLVSMRIEPFYRLFPPKKSRFPHANNTQIIEPFNKWVDFFPPRKERIRSALPKQRTFFLGPQVLCQWAGTRVTGTLHSISKNVRLSQGSLCLALLLTTSPRSWCCSRPMTRRWTPRPVQKFRHFRPIEFLEFFHSVSQEPMHQKISYLYINCSCIFYTWFFILVFAVLNFPIWNTLIFVLLSSLFERFPPFRSKANKHLAPKSKTRLTHLTQNLSPPALRFKMCRIQADSFCEHSTSQRDHSRAREGFKGKETLFAPTVYLHQGPAGIWGLGTVVLELCTLKERPLNGQVGVRQNGSPEGMPTMRSPGSFWILVTRWEGS